MSRTQARSAAAAIAVALVLAACTDDPEPKRADPTSDSPSPSPTETSPPTSPPTDDPEPLSPEDTVRAWVEALNTMAVTGDTKAFVALGSPRCRQCGEIEGSITAIYAAGGYTRSRGWKIAQVQRTDDFDKTRVVAAAIEAARSVTVDEPGAEPRTTKADKFIVDFELERVGPGEWIIRGLDFLS